MALILNSTTSTPVLNKSRLVKPSYSSQRLQSRKQFMIKACIFEQPLLKEALKEPVAFFGGVFAGLLRLDLNEDPLKEWITRTVEASGFADDGIGGQGGSTSPKQEDEESPQQIEIE